MRTHVQVFGCKVNQYEAARVKVALGADYVNDPWEADVIMVFGCVVTAKAEAEVRQFVKRYLKIGRRVILTGCGTKVALKDLSELGAVLVPPEGIDKFCADHIETLPTQLPFTPERSRGFVKVQDGCDRGCRYCLSWIERGRPRSRPLSQISEEIEALRNNGVFEIVLTGTNVMLWRDPEAHRVGNQVEETQERAGHGAVYLDLLEAVGSQAARLGMRVRISSIYPEMLTEEMVQLLLSKPFAHHLHLSLQSASLRVLRDMGRGSLSALERGLKSLLDADPFFALTADVIVGYPTESEQDFLFTLSFLSQHRFSKIHVFPFSPRPATVAASLSPLRSGLVKQRERLVQEFSSLMKARFVRGQVGMYRPAVYIIGHHLALTDNYIYVPSEPFDGIRNIRITEQSYMM
ncbi:radical SAM protein [Coprothermobacteraceae bacterium]|nr:radical SAM protein [Coprothermobacteraceae bacterium]